MDEQRTYPDGITQQDIDAIKQNGKSVKEAMLYDADGNYLNVTLIVKTPSAQAMSEFEKKIDRKPAEARKILMKSCMMNRKEIADMAFDTVLFNAAFAACSEMLPYGKAELKNL